MAVTRSRPEDASQYYFFGHAELFDFERGWLEAFGIPEGYQNIPIGTIRDLYRDVLTMGPQYERILEAACIINEPVIRGKDTEAVLTALLEIAMEDERFIALEKAYSQNFNDRADSFSWSITESTYRVMVSLQLLSMLTWQPKNYLRISDTDLEENWVLVVFFFGLIGEGILQDNPVADDKRRKAEPFFLEVLESINAICD